MRRTAFVIALLLAVAPVARAENPAAELKPNLQVVEATAPTVRQDAAEPVISERRTEAPSRATAQYMTRSTWLLIGALVLAGVIIGVLL